ncbi:glutathione S-transferase [Rhodoferax sp.]|uniref:glutathione S-transferase n=1 Tax=Rhodoferax sp. TaxID=50421 RepID=UPI00284C3F40|nr:glutathione S-transferase [Rhodoferax sp.]MDR3371313.1 glutathione S-transferase [Rhodoferax sp.]
MKLIGMLDSPYVRRTAIALKLLGIPFEHLPLSVFSTFDAFRALNPVVKAPTLILDDGQVLMDSSLILDYAQHCLGAKRSLLPDTTPERVTALRHIGLALAACEKTVQIVYERNLRPIEKQHEPLMARFRGQLLDAYTALEHDGMATAENGDESSIGLSGVSVAVAWRFTQLMLPEIVRCEDFPKLRQFSAWAEELPVFLSTPIV